MSFKVELLEPAKDFILSLEDKLKAKALRSIELLEELGNELREPYSKKIKDKNGLFELRIKQGNNICRFFYFFQNNKIIILTSGFVKKTQKTDPGEIKKAINLMNIFKENQND